MKIRHILVPVDFSDSSRAALEYAGLVAEKLGADIDVLHVWESPRYVWPDTPVEVPGQPKQALEQFARASAARELDENLRVLSGRRLARIGRKLAIGDARETILRAVRDGDYDLVVMGTHGRTGLAHLLMGSVAEQIVRKSPCPVLTVRAGAAHLA